MMKEPTLSFDKWCNILELLYLCKNERTKTFIGYELRIQYAHVHKILNRLQKEKMVQFRPTGRNVYVSLTNKGKTIAENINNIYETIKK